MTESADDQRFRMLQERLEEATRALETANLNRTALRGKLTLAKSDKEEAEKQLAQIKENIGRGNKEQTRIRGEFQERAETAEDLIHEGLVFPWDHPVFEGWEVIEFTRHQDYDGDLCVIVTLYNEFDNNAFREVGVSDESVWMELMQRVFKWGKGLAQ